METLEDIGIGTPPPQVAADDGSDVWHSLDWQKALFGYLLAAESVGEAYDDSLSDYPELIPATVAEGDLSIALAGGGRAPDWMAMVLPLLGIGMFGSVGAQLLRGER